MADDFTLTARWVFPVTAAPLVRGLVTVRGDRIAAVEPHGMRTADIDLGDVAIVPGFVNAHTHLDLTGARGLTPPTPDFVGWLRRVIAFRRERTSEQVVADVHVGIAESLRFGTTLVGDIAAKGQSWDQLAQSPLRAVVYYELLGLSRDRAEQAASNAAQWLNNLGEHPTLRAGLSPHAPYSVNQHSLLTAIPLSLRPAAIHLAETTAELELLEHHRGPFVSFLTELGAWDPAGLARSADHVVSLTNCGLAPVVYVHCNYLSPNVPIPPHGTVVYCPRTHAAFDHPPHPFREFLVRGVRVALGTDSLASNPDLSILGEARFVRSRYPGFSSDILLRLATLNGAQALGWSYETGNLKPGKSADFAIVALPNHDAADSHELLFDSDLPVVATWFRGREVYRQNSPRRHGEREENQNES